MIPYGTKKYKPQRFWSPLPTEAKDILFMPYEGPMNPLMTMFVHIQGWLGRAENRNLGKR